MCLDCERTMAIYEMSCPRCLIKEHIQGLTMNPTKITDDYIELDPTALLDHMEKTFENPNPKVEAFLQSLRDNPKGVVRVKAVGEETYVTKEKCIMCNKTREIFGADCPYCTEGV